MPPKKGTKIQTQGHTASASAGAILTEMANDSRIRTTEKSKKLREGYEDDLSDLEDRIHDKLREERKALSSIRADQLTRLLALIDRKAAIEVAIAEAHARLHVAYDRASRDLRRAIKCRVEFVKGVAGEMFAGGGDDGDDGGREEDGYSDGDEDEGEERKDGGENKENEAPRRKR